MHRVALNIKNHARRLGAHETPPIARLQKEVPTDQARAGRDKYRPLWTKASSYSLAANFSQAKAPQSP